MLTEMEQQLVRDCMPIAQQEARISLAKYGMCGLDYHELCSIGYYKIVDVISSGRYKTLKKLNNNSNPLEAYMVVVVRSEIRAKIREYKPYEPIYDDNGEVVHDIPYIQFNDNREFDYDSTRELLIFLLPEEQKILRYIGRDLTLDAISNILHIDPSTLDKKIRKIKNKLQKWKKECVHDN